MVAGGQEYAPRVSLLGIAVESLQSGVVIRLTGEADLSTVGQLRDALNGQTPGGARQLTIDLSGLRFADAGTRPGRPRPGRDPDRPADPEDPFYQHVRQMRQQQSGNINIARRT